MTKNHEQLILVPPGVELNYGLSEDSDSQITLGPTTLRVVGEAKNGAIPVRLVDESGVESGEVFYFHQPEPKPAKI